MSPSPAALGSSGPGDTGRVLPFKGAGVDRTAQLAWAGLPIQHRLEVVRRLRQSIAEHAERLIRSVRLRQRRSRAETLAAEILPLADACRFLEREAAALLAPKELGRRGRPFWLGGSHLEIRREPFGIVLVIAPENYPLLLPGVQALQALVAGNAVSVKPGRGGGAAANQLAELLKAAGLPGGLMVVLDESPRAAEAAIAAGVDKVVLTGSLATGQAVSRQLAESVTPAVMELSGCDAAIVLADADVTLAAAALRFGLTFNSSYTCIAPRRVLVHSSRQHELEAQLRTELADLEPLPVAPAAAAEAHRLAGMALDGGARVLGGLPNELTASHGDEGQRSMHPLVLTGVRPGMAILDADLAAPVLSLVTVGDEREARDVVARGRYRLGATIFGGKEPAQALARELPAGVVVINDLIVPTADPRLPFGGRAASGHGVTRGAEGLLEMTQLKSVVRRAGRFRPHLEPTGTDEEALLGAFVQVSHARSLSSRLRAAFDIVRLTVRGARRGDDNPGRSS
ncbi:MAG: aldehyde dehydrogenase family protein [Acidobacteriota bacterium]